MYLRFAFLITLATYVLLILAEVLEPGFVSHYFSTHWLLLLLVFLFAGLVHKEETIQIRPALASVVTTVVAVVFAVVTWRLGGPLNELRPLFTLIVFALPFAIANLLNSDV